MTQYICVPQRDMSCCLVPQKSNETSTAAALEVFVMVEDADWHVTNGVRHAVGHQTEKKLFIATMITKGPAFLIIKVTKILCAAGKSCCSSELKSKS